MKNLYGKSLLLFIVLVICNLIVFTLFRVIFLICNYEENFIIQEMWTAFYIGFKFDLRLALLLNLPVFILGGFSFFYVFRNQKTKYVWLGYLILTNFIVLMLNIADFALYDYLGDRLNASAYRYLYNPDMSFGMLTSAYPFIFILLGLVAAIIFLFLFFRCLFKKIENFTKYQLKGKKNVVAYISTLLLTSAGLFGQWASFPLTWSNAYFSTNQFISSLTINPVLHLGESMFWETPQYDLEKVKQYYPIVSEYLGVQNKDSDRLNFTRTVEFPATKKKPNIVIVFMESLAFHKSGLSGNPLSPTPNFDKIAEESVYFNRFYTPHRHTARSIFTLVTGLPDIGLVESTSRNPMFVKQDTIINAFAGYEKFYLLNGNASWSNIRGIISHNIENLKLFEEHMYSSPKLDVWGISDLHLFEEFIGEVKKVEDKPFIALIQTSGNHSPFLIPEDNRNFEVKEISKKEALKNGFKHSAEYNSLRFMDHSFGIFMDRVKKDLFFDDTIFCFFGDHGKRVYHHELAFMPKAQHDLNLTHYHVPFIIYAPKILAPYTESKIASEMDVLPTVAHLASVSYVNTGLGKDLFDKSLDQNRYAFTLNYGDNEIGLLNNEYYFLCATSGKNPRLHRLDSEAPLDNLFSLQPKTAKEMEALCRGLYETTKFIRAQKGNLGSSEHK